MLKKLLSKIAPSHYIHTDGSHIRTAKQIADLKFDGNFWKPYIRVKGWYIPL